MTLSVLLLLAAAGLAVVVAARHRRRSKEAERARELWDELSQNVQKACAVSLRGAGLSHCFLRAGYVVPDATSAAALAGWVRSQLGYEVAIIPENDPTFGPYWIVETSARDEVTSDLPFRWVESMRQVCEQGALRVERFGIAGVWREPPPEAGGILASK